MLHWLFIGIGSFIVCSDRQELSVPCFFVNNTENTVLLAKSKDHVSKKSEMREIDLAHTHVLAPKELFEGKLLFKGNDLYFSEQIIVGYIDNKRLENAWRHEPCFKRMPNKIDVFIVWKKNNGNQPVLTFEVKYTGNNVNYLGSNLMPFKNIESYKKHD